MKITSKLAVGCLSVALLGLMGHNWYSKINTPKGIIRLDGRRQKINFRENDAVTFSREGNSIVTYRYQGERNGEKVFKRMNGDEKTLDELARQGYVPVYIYGQEKR
ncbi:MAG: hypothetical protein KKB21_05470 [Nanoarchaeota archaeon]|nr:hypothetical protein [Nanoarchaeota archaeon]MBU4086996.1 hypothetical protein [Nanoarchaeota archaeon]